MDDTDLLLREMLQLAGKKPTSAERLKQQLDDIRSVLDSLIKYRKAKKTVLRDKSRRATAVEVEGFGRLKINNKNGLIESLGGIKPIAGVQVDAV